MEKATSKDNESDHLEIIKKLIQSMRFGSISIIIQDGKIVQIEKTEKYRIKD